MFTVKFSLEYYMGITQVSCEFYMHSQNLLDVQHIETYDVIIEYSIVMSLCLHSIKPAMLGPSQALF